MPGIRGIVITGRPGSGKTTLFNALIREALKRGVRPAGFSCPEIRVGGARIGFRIRDLASGKEAWLARRDGCFDGPRVGRYHVCVEEALSIGLPALRRAGRASLLGIDELGPMELGIPPLRRAVLEALAESRGFIVVAHVRLHDQGILEIIRKPEARWVTIARESRDKAWREAFRLLGEMLRGVRFEARGGG